MSKATHTGSCQLCGRMQKLPGGLLSNHGYTVEWSCFQGTCPGSHGKPFEVAYDLVQGAIDRAVRQARALRAEAAQVRHSTDLKKVWMNVYYAATWERGNRHSRYVWEQRELVAEAHEDSGHKFWTYHTLGSKGEHHRHDHYTHPSDPASVVKAANAKYAEHLEKQAQHFTKYAKWQQERIDTWKPGVLVPVAK